MVPRKRDSATENLEDVWLAVEEECISILDVTKMVRNGEIDWTWYFI